MTLRNRWQRRALRRWWLIYGPLLQWLALVALAFAAGWCFAAMTNH